MSVPRQVAFTFILLAIWAPILYFGWQIIGVRQ
jgi:hypothetical protein